MLDIEKKIVDQNGQLLSNKTHLSISHAALFLNVSRPTIYKRIEAGELHPIKLGKRTIRIPIHELSEPPAVDLQVCAFEEEAEVCG